MKIPWPAVTPAFVHVSIEEMAVRTIQEQMDEAVPRGNARAIGTAKKARHRRVEQAELATISSLTAG